MRIPTIIKINSALLNFKIFANLFTLSKCFINKKTYFFSLYLSLEFFVNFVFLDIILFIL